MIPQRMCVVCRERRDKNQLLRIVKQGEGKLSIDKDGKMQGRGAYICQRSECIKNAHKRRSLERSFRCSIDDSIYKELLELGDTDDYKD